MHASQASLHEKRAYSPINGASWLILVGVAVMTGILMVRITPALVPIHRISLHASSAVIRRQAALCCRIISSQPLKKGKNESFLNSDRGRFPGLHENKSHVCASDLRLPLCCQSMARMDTTINNNSG